jgi:integrase
MGKIRIKNSKCFYDFRYRGLRCREYTLLPESKNNLKIMQQSMDKIEAEITLDEKLYFEVFNPSMKNKSPKVGSLRRNHR